MGTALAEGEASGNHINPRIDHPSQTSPPDEAARPAPGGRAIDLRGAGRIVIRRMVLMPAARALGLHQKGFALVNADGRRIVELPVVAFGGEGLVSEVEILRGELAHLLYEAILPDVEYVGNVSITGFEQDDGGVTVTFENGAPRHSASCSASSRSPTTGATPRRCAGWSPSGSSREMGGVEAQAMHSSPDFVLDSMGRGA